MLSSRHKLSLARDGAEVSNLGKIKVKRKVHIFVTNSQCHITSVVLRAFTELEVLAVKFEVGLTSTSHHLNLQIMVHDSLSMVRLEFHNSKGSEIFSFLVSKSTFRL